MSSFVNNNRLKHALLLATTQSSKGHLLRPRTFGMEALVAEFMPGLKKRHTGAVSLESMADDYQAHNEDVSPVASDSLDSQVDDLVAFVRDTITTARERVVPVAKRLETLLTSSFAGLTDVFAVESDETSSSINDLLDYLEIPSNIVEPRDDMQLSVPKSDAEIVALLKESQVFPKDVTERFVESIDEAELARYYNAFYSGRFSYVNPLFAPANTSIAKDCLMVGLMASEYFARNVARAEGVVTLPEWNRVVTLMTRFCLSRFAKCLQTESNAANTGDVIVSVTENDKRQRVVRLRKHAMSALGAKEVPVEAVLGGVLTHGASATRLKVLDFVKSRDIFLRRYEREAPMLRLSIRAKLMEDVKRKLVSFVAEEVNPTSDRLERLRKDVHVQKLASDNISSIAAYVAAVYVVGNTNAAIYLDMMEAARLSNDGRRPSEDTRDVAAAATVDFVAYVLASNIDVGRIAPVTVEA